MVRKAWYLSAYNNPTRRVAGPFETYDEANERAVQMASVERKWDAALHMRMPATYVPTLLPVPETTHGTMLIKPTKPSVPVNIPVRGTDHTTQPKPKAHSLPNEIYKLREAQLRLIADKLNVDITQCSDRRSLVAKIKQAVEY